MRKIRYLSLVFVVAMIAFFSLGSFGIFGAWIYSGSVSQPLPLHVELGLFAWEGSEILPGGGGETPENPDIPVPEVPVGENHMALIKRLVESDVGLNNASSFLNSYIEDRLDDNKDNAASVAPTPGGNLKSLFNTYEMSQLDFMIHIVTDSNGQTIYEIYTFETALVGNKEGIEADPVYKTILTLQNGRWTPIKTSLGKGYSMRYDAKQGGGKYMTINPDTWVQS